MTKDADEDDSDGKPMEQPNNNWTEFDWERALRQSDGMAQRYFRLLNRFSDLPGADRLIARRMGSDFEPALLEMDTPGDYAWKEWSEEDEAFFGTQAENFPAYGGGDGRDEDEVDPSLFYETDPVFVSLRQSALGWCNVYAVSLPRENLDRGLNILYHLGRSLANLAYSIDDGSYENPASSVAFAKRSLASLNLAIRELDALIQEQKRIEELLKTMRFHFIKSVDHLVDHLARCRARQPGKDDHHYN